MKKRILSRLLACMLLACMLLNSLPVAAFAEEVQPECSHVCDESCGYVAPAAAVACDKDCKPAEEGGEVTHVEGCAYKAAEEGSPCTHKHNGECGVECAHNYVDGKCACGAECTHNYVEGVCTVCNMAQSKPVCNCGTEDAFIHATTCAVYAAPEKPECHCVEKCLEANIWCDVCGIDYSLCSGTGKAEAYTDHKHCLSVHEDCTGHDDAVTWTAWEETNFLPTSGNYYLTEDVILSAQQTVSGTLNLCLNGHTITPSGSGFSAIKITGNLSLTDCQGNGEITGFTNNAGKGGAVYSEGTFTMYGGIISGNTVTYKYYNDGMGGGVYSNGTFTMHGGTISDNEASFFGGGVYIAPGKQFTMSGGTISGNKVTTTGNAQNYGGGGVYSDGNFTMSGGTIKNNKANTMGGGVCISNIPNSTAASTFTMHNGTIIDNEAPDGGGVYIDSGKQFTMSDGTISGNTSTASGGGVRVNGTFTMSNGTISGNNAGYGGGVYISPTSASFTMTGGNITGNAATNNGGGVYMYGGAEAFNLSGSPIISGNTGGNCYIENKGTCFMTVTGALGENAKIGITTWSSMPSRPFCMPASSVDLSNYKNWFFSDSIDRAIAKNDDGSLYTMQVTAYPLTFDSEKAKVTVHDIETTKAAAGNIVVISPIVPEGATVESVTVSGCAVTKNEDGTYSFTMPEDSVTITVTFNSPTVDVTGVTLVKDTLELAVGDSETLTAIVAPDNATNKNVSWTSGNTEVATVDETGKVTAVGAGTATITVKTEDGEFTDTRTVTVVEKYDLFVGGVQVTSDNKGDLVTAINQAANATVATGSATYNPETCTLTLNGFSYTGAGYLYDEWYDVCYYAAIYTGENLNVVLIGDNTITCTATEEDYCTGISCDAALTISDNTAGTLTVKANEEGIYCYSVTIDGTTVDISNSYYGIYCNSVTIADSVVNVNSNDTGIDAGSITIESSIVDVFGTEDAMTCEPTLKDPHKVYAGVGTAGLYEYTEGEREGWIYEMSHVQILKENSGYYPVWIGAEQFTDDNLTINGTTGTAIYTPTTKTLTLNNFSYTGEGALSDGIEMVRYYAVITSSEETLNIVLQGENSITCTGNGEYNYFFGINATNLTISDDTSDASAGSLKVTGDASGVWVNSLEIEGCIVEMSGGDYAIYSNDIPILNGDFLVYAGTAKEHELIASPEDETYANKYVKIVPAYTVTYMAGEDEVYTEKVEHGKDVANVPEVPAKEGYNETAPKWDKDGKNITADTEINAVYTKNQPGEYVDVTPDTNVGGGKVAEEIEELKEKVPFTQEEEKQIEYGADVEVWLEIKDISDSVSSEEKAKVEEKLGDAHVALYLDIAMFKQVGENAASRLTQLSDKVQITFKLDDSYINTDKDVTRTYSIIHVHDGKAEVITPVFDANAKTLSFQTDRFSTYALVYTDVVNTPPTGETVPPTEKPAPPAESPVTGDSFQPAFWIACMTLSIFGIAVLLLDAKRRHAR